MTRRRKRGPTARQWAKNQYDMEPWAERKTVRRIQPEERNGDGRLLAVEPHWRSELDGVLRWPGEEEET